MRALEKKDADEFAEEQREQNFFKEIIDMNDDRYRWFVMILGMIIMWISITLTVNFVFAFIGGQGGGGDGDEAAEEVEEEGVKLGGEGRLLMGVQNLTLTGDLGPSLNLTRLREVEKEMKEKAKKMKIP